MLSVRALLPYVVVGMPAEFGPSARPLPFRVMPFRPLSVALTWLNTMPVDARVIFTPSMALSVDCTDVKVEFVTYRCSTRPSISECSTVAFDIVTPSALVRNSP